MQLEQAAAEAGLELDDAKNIVARGWVSPDPETELFDAWRIAQLSVAKRALDLGVAEEEIAALMRYFASEAASCAALEQAANARQAEFDAQLAKLRETQRRYHAEKTEAA